MSKFVMVLMLSIIILSVGYVYAEENSLVTGVTTEQNKPVEVGNKLCPVTKEKVGEMGKTETIEYKGKVYNLCCAMCRKDFNKDPEKYSKIADEEVKAAAKEKAGH